MKLISLITLIICSISSAPISTAQTRSMSGEEVRKLIQEASSKHKKVALVLHQGTIWTSAASFPDGKVYTLAKEKTIGGYVTASIFGGENFTLYESTYTAQYHVHMKLRFADVVTVKKYNGFRFGIRQATDITSTVLLRAVTLCLFFEP